MSLRPNFKHPFAIEAFFEQSIVLSYAFPAQALQALLPPRLVLDSKGPWGFGAVALVQTKHLRPKGFPKWAGRNFFLVGYRIFVRYQTKSGKSLRGLYILRSETDRKSMVRLGNMLTHYRYHKVDVSREETQKSIQITHNDGLDLSVLKPSTNSEAGESPTAPATVPLPTGSPFASWRDARRFAGPLPFTFAVSPKGREVCIVEGVRRNWQPQPMQVLHAKVPFFDTLLRSKGVLASAFTVENVPYSWKKGVSELWDTQGLSNELCLRD